MANRPTVRPAKTPRVEGITLEGRFTTNSTSDPAAANTKGDIDAVVRDGVGEFTATFKFNMRHYNRVTAQLIGDTDHVATVKSVNAQGTAEKTIVVVQTRDGGASLAKADTTGLVVCIAVHGANSSLDRGA